MERAVTQPAQRAARQRIVSISPAPDGWRIIGAAPPAAQAAPPDFAPTLDEAAARVPAGATLHFSLPVAAVLLERVRLPSTDPAELAGMVLLQLEKTLPFSSDEVTSGFQPIQHLENETDLLAVAASNAQMDQLCAPLRAHRLLPAQVGVFAIQLAARFPSPDPAALIYREGGATLLAIIQNGALLAAHTVPCASREEFAAELPRLLLTAEMEGAPVHFTRLLLESGLESWSPSLHALFPGLPIQPVSLDAPVEPGPLNLIPAGWTLEQKKLAQQARIRDWLAIAGIVYLILLLAAAAAIIFLQHQLGAIDSQVAAATPAVDAIAARRARWTALQPAIEPTRYPLEILLQASQCIPSDELRITVLDLNPGEFVIEGEANTASMAIQYVETLRQTPAFKLYQIESGPPEILPNEHAHFRIFTKL